MQNQGREPSQRFVDRCLPYHVGVDQLSAMLLNYFNDINSGRYDFAYSQWATTVL